MALPLVYVINLARSPDRLARVGSALDAAGLKWQRVEAVDGRQFGDLPWEHFDDFAYRYLWGKTPHPNELGCYLSHYRALQTFLGTDAEAAVIVEDDAAFADDIRDVVAELMEHADRWDMVKLDSRHWGMPVTTLPMKRGHRLVAFTQRSTGSSGYIVNRKAAEAYVEKLLPMKVPYDHAFDQAWRFGFRMRGVLPHPIRPGGFASDIGYQGKQGRRRLLYRRTIAPLYRAQIEIARVLYYLVRDPVWVTWLANQMAGRR